MIEIPAGSHSSVKYVPRVAGVVVQPDTVTVTAADETGAAVDFNGSAQWSIDDSAIVLELAPADELAAVASLFRSGELVFAWEKDSKTFRDPEPFDVVDVVSENRPFLSIAEAKRLLDIEPADSDQNRTVREIVVDASEAIRQHVRKKLTIGLVTEARTVWLDAGDKCLRPEELVSVDSVVDAYGNDVTFVVQRKAGGFITKLSVACARGGELQITGTWGYARLPRVIRDATVKTVRVWFLRDVAHLTKEVDASGVSTAPRDLPDAVIESLDLFEPSVGLS